MALSFVGTKAFRIRPVRGIQGYSYVNLFSGQRHTPLASEQSSERPLAGQPR